MSWFFFLDEYASSVNYFIVDPLLLQILAVIVQFVSFAFRANDRYEIITDKESRRIENLMQPTDLTSLIVNFRSFRG